MSFRLLQQTLLHIQLYFPNKFLQYKDKYFYVHRFALQRLGEVITEESQTVRITSDSHERRTKDEKFRKGCNDKWYQESTCGFSLYAFCDSGYTGEI